MAKTDHVIPLPPHQEERDRQAESYIEVRKKSARPNWQVNIEAAMYKMIKDGLVVYDADKDVLTMTTAGWDQAAKG